MQYNVHALEKILDKTCIVTVVVVAVEYLVLAVCVINYSLVDNIIHVHVFLSVYSLDSNNYMYYLLDIKIHLKHVFVSVPKLYSHSEEKSHHSSQGNKSGEMISDYLII